MATPLSQHCMTLLVSDLMVLVLVRPVFVVLLLVFR